MYVDEVMLWLSEVPERVSKDVSGSIRSDGSFLIRDEVSNHGHEVSRGVGGKSV